MAEYVLIPFAGEHIALTVAELEAARQRAREVLPLSPAPASGSSAEPLLTAEVLAALLDVPQSQIETMARQGRIPSLLVGKYRRFDRAAVLNALHTVPHSDDDSRAAKNKRPARTVTNLQPVRRGGA